MVDANGGLAIHVETIYGILAFGICHSISHRGDDRRRSECNNEEQDLPSPIPYLAVGSTVCLARSSDSTLRQR